MNKDKLYQLLQNPPKQLNEEELALLDELLEEYPFFQTADILKTLHYKNRQSIRFPKFLKKTAISTPDRQKLMHLLNTGHFKQVIKAVPEVNLKKKEEEKDSKHTESKKAETKDKPIVKKQPEEKIANKPLPAIEKVKEQPVNLSDKSEKKDIEQEKQPKKEQSSLTFSEWLNKLGKDKSTEKYAAYNPDDYGFNKIKGVKKRTTESTKLIDRFIKESPSISRPKTSMYSAEDMARRSIMEHDDIVSETLAQINENQGHFERALKMYEKLSLLNPEKSNYFAVKITALKNKLNK